VRQVRLYADQGGSPTSLDGWVSGVKIHAEEIAGGFPKRERKTSIGWWGPVVTLLLLIIAGAWLVSRYQERSWPFAERPQPVRMRRR
jgi:hypothetical protein